MIHFQAHVVTGRIQLHLGYHAEGSVPSWLSASACASFCAMWAFTQQDTAWQLASPKGESLLVRTLQAHGMWSWERGLIAFSIVYLLEAKQHKEQILKAAREKQQITHKGIPIRITADLSIETLQARREWQDILKVMKENNLQPRSLYPTRISFRYEEEFKSFTDKQKLREFSTTKPALQQMLKDLL